MSMNGPGMWMPKKNEGVNWRMSYHFLYTDGSVQEGVKGFRIKSDAAEWKSRMNNAAFGTKAMVGKVDTLTFGKVTKAEK